MNFLQEKKPCWLETICLFVFGLGMNVLTNIEMCAFCHIVTCVLCRLSSHLLAAYHYGFLLDLCITYPIWTGA